MLHELVSTERKGETATPDATLKLIEALGITRAARLIGTSTTTLHKARKQGIVSKVVEVAATAKLNELSMPLSKDLATSSAPRKLYLAEVDQDKSEMAEKLLKALGAEFIVA